VRTISIWEGRLTTQSTFPASYRKSRLKKDANKSVPVGQGVRTCSPTQTYQRLALAITARSPFCPLPLQYRVFQARSSPSPVDLSPNIRLPVESGAVLAWLNLVE